MENNKSKKKDVYDETKLPKELLDIVGQLLVFIEEVDCEKEKKM